METYMQNELTEEVVIQAAKLYDVDPKTIVKIGGFENFVFSFDKNDESFILRFVHSGHRPFEQVLAEIEFIDYLAHNKARVSTIIHSVNNQIAERIDINQEHYFTISVFTKAKGKLVEPKDLTANFYQMFGREVGRLHRLTKTYKPKHRRPHWYEENFRSMMERHVSNDEEIMAIFNQVEQTIKGLPRCTDNYGLIHTDLHFHNMFYDGEQLTFFDFDDAAYKHFLSDIAIIIFYNYRHQGNEHPEYNQNVRWMLENLLRGYRKENEINMDFFRNINEFLLLRSVILYVVVVSAGYTTHEDVRYRNYAARTRELAVHRLMDLDLDFVLEKL